MSTSEKNAYYRYSGEYESANRPSEMILNQRHLHVTLYLNKNRIQLYANLEISKFFYPFHLDQNLLKTTAHLLC